MADELQAPLGAAERPTALTPTENRLLKVFQSHPGRVFTRAELTQQVMPGTVVLERTIDVHVAALRKKLGQHVGKIQTVRRVGYQFLTPL